MYSRKIYATGSATANNVANVTVPKAGRIVAVQWHVRVNSITDGAQVSLEISRASATEIAVNEAQQAIAQIEIEGNFVTSGLSQGGVNQFFPVDVPLTQGQIIYMHAVVAGTVVYTGGAILWLI